MVAIERGDLDEFKKLVAKEHTLEEDEFGFKTHKVHGIRESDVMRAVAVTQNWEMLGHLFSLGSPVEFEEMGDFVAIYPQGAKVIDVLIANYPGIKGGQNGTKFLCQLVSQLEFSGGEEPHPFIRNLVDGGVSVESKPYSALIAAVESRDVALIKYLMKNGADPMARSRWHLRSSRTSEAITFDFDARLIATVSRSIAAAKALGRINAFSQKKINEFEENYPSQPESPILGTYEVEHDPRGGFNHALPNFRLLPDRTAVVPEFGMFNSAVWTLTGKKLVLYPIELEGPEDRFPTVLEMTGTPGEFAVTKINGEAVKGITARLLTAADPREFKVPGGSAGIGMWTGSYASENTPELSITMELRNDGTGVMNLIPEGGAAIEMKSVWKHDSDSKQIVIYQVVDGKVQRDGAMTAELSDDGKTLTATDEGPTFKKVE
jgi:hypothetical protein